MAAILEQDFRMGGLEIIDTDFGAWNMRGNRQHRHAAAMTIVEAIDQMYIARAATAGANRQLSREMSLGASGEGCALFVAHMHPFNGLAAPQGVGEAVERVADNAVDSLDAGIRQRLGHEIRSSLAHRRSSKELLIGRVERALE